MTASNSFALPRTRRTRTLVMSVAFAIATGAAFIVMSFATNSAAGPVSFRERDGAIVGSHWQSYWSGPGDGMSSSTEMVGAHWRSYWSGLGDGPSVPTAMVGSHWQSY